MWPDRQMEVLSERFIFSVPANQETIRLNLSWLATSEGINVVIDYKNYYPSGLIVIISAISHLATFIKSSGAISI